MASLANTITHGHGFRRDHDILQVWQILKERLETEAMMVKTYACYEVHGKSVFFAKAPLGLFHEKAPFFGQIRRYLVWLTEWKWFDRTILAAIVVNSFLLVLPASYNPEDADPDQVQILDSIALFLTLLFTCEMGVKVVARGLFWGSSTCYLRDAWNWLDGFVVFTGMLELVAGGSGGFRVFRTFRILRPLRSINSLPELRIVVQALLTAGRSLGSWLIIVGFVYILFAITGTTLFGDVYWNRCRLTSEPVLSTCVTWNYTAALPSVDPKNCSTLYDLGKTQTLGQAKLLFEAHSECTSGGKPAILRSGYSSWGTKCTPDYSTCTQTNENWDDSHLATSMPCTTGSESHYVWIPDADQTRFCGGRYTCQPTRDGKETFCRNPVDRDYDLLTKGYDPWREINNNPHADWGSTGFQSFQNGILTGFQVTTKEGWSDLMYRYQDGSDTVVAVIYFVFLMLFGSMIVMKLVLAILWERYDTIWKQQEHDKILNAEKRTEKLPNKILRTKLSDLVTEVHFLEKELAMKMAFKALDANTDANMKNILYTICSDKKFNAFIMTVIVMNTITLALVSEPPLAKPVVDTCEGLNQFFTYVFLFEAICKIGGMGIDYWSDNSNLFDLSIVIISLIELNEEGEGSGASALRVARLLRLFRLADGRVSMKVLMMVITRAASATYNFCLLVMLMLYIFALIGIQAFFDKELDTEAEDKRLNFNSFLWAFITVFSILVGDRWDLLTKNIMVYSGNRLGAYMFVITLVFVGHVVLLSLFLGIFASSFANARDAVLYEYRYKMYDLVVDKTPAKAEESEIPRREKKKEEEADAEAEEKNVACENMNIVRMIRGKKAALKHRAQGAVHNNGLGNGFHIGDTLAGHLPGKASFTAGQHSAPPPPALDTDDAIADYLQLYNEDEAESTYQHRIFLRDGEHNSLHHTDRVQHSDDLLQHNDVEVDSNHLLRVFRKDGQHNAPPEGGPPNLPPGTSMVGFEDNLVSQSTSSSAMGMGSKSLSRTMSLKKNSATNFLPEGSQGPESLYDSRKESVYEMQSRSQIIYPTWHEKVPGPPTALVELCRKVALQPHFDHFIMFLIIFSSLTLAIDSPYMPDDGLKKTLASIDYVFTAIFALEMIMKMLALGIVVPYPELEQPAYLCVGWNWIDSIVVVTALLDIIMSSVSGGNSSLRSLRALRTLRALRPLRLIKRNKGMKCIVDALLGCLPTMTNMLLIAFLFYFGMGVLFVNLFKGALFFCSLDPTGRTLPDLNTKADCEKLGGQWLNSESNFDNVVEAFMTLFHMGTPEGWITVMLSVVDSRGIDMQPRPNANPGHAIVVLIFVSLANFFVLNLFIGVLIDQYTFTKSEILGEDTFSPEDKLFNLIQRNFLDPNAFNKRETMMRGTGCHAQVWRLVESHAFESLILFCIFANTVLMCLRHPTESDDFSDLMGNLNFIFAMVFNVEAVLKLFVYKAKYFKDPWNIFDFVIVVGTDVTLVIKAVGTESSIGNVAPIVRVFRIARVLRMIRQAQSLRVLFTTLFYALPSLLNVGALLMLVLFMFACLGISLFGTVADGEEVGPAANFRSFGDALLLLLRCSTGERWHKIMYDVVGDRPGCTSETQSPEDLNLNGPNGCGNVLGYVYFVVFIITVTFVVLNLFVAAVLDGFKGVALREKMIDYEKQKNYFFDLWFSYDTDGNLGLHLDDVIKILHQIPPPFGFLGNSDRHARLYCRWLPMENISCEVHIRDVIVLAVKRAFLYLTGEKEKDVNQVPMNEELVYEWVSAFPAAVNEYMVAHMMIRERFQASIEARRKKFGGAVTKSMSTLGAGPLSAGSTAGAAGPVPVSGISLNPNTFSTPDGQMQMPGNGPTCIWPPNSGDNENGENGQYRNGHAQYR